MVSPRKKSRSSKRPPRARKPRRATATCKSPPLPRSKPTDPPVPRIPTDPRTWPAWRKAFGWAHRHFFPRPQSPWPEDHPIVPELVARRVVREVMLALDLARFPEKRWGDWLTRRAHTLYRIDRKFRARMNCAHDREYCYSYMRHWFYIGLRRSGWKYADLLPDEMHSGHPPTREGITSWKRWRLPSAA